MQSFSQHADSYFPSPAQTFAYSSQVTGGFIAQNIDDIVYRYSSEVDRGTPMAGAYSQDGLWDEDEAARKLAAQPESSQATTVSREGHSLKGRSRSGIISTLVPKEEKEKSGGMWGWAKKTHGSPAVDVQLSPEVVKAPFREMNLISVVKKEKSLGRLRGKGRRGELSVTVTGDPDESFESTSRPLPDTPASFLTDPSPAFSASPFLSPISFPSRLSINPDSSFHTMTGSKGSKSSWKRGVEKIFRSRSSAVLREAFNGQENQPSIHQPQTTPQQAKKPFGKHFSSSTPPMPFDESHRENVFSYHASGHLSPPPTAKSESFHRYSHPSLPHDPFASSLNLSSNQLSTTLTLIDSPKLGPPSSSRPRLSRNSPSLRDLKNLLPRPSKPSLSKAKSMANIREGEVPATPPADKTDYFSSYTLAKRMSSVIGLSHRARSDPNEEILSPAPMTIRPAPVTRPQFMRMPTESPPLLPPNPPYFPTSSSMSLRSPSLSSNLSSSVSSSGTSSTPGSRISSTQTLNTTLVLSSSMLTLAPTAPLPPSPGASTHPKPAVMAMQRSASGAVLLPRSRSTSMSLKAPPTSSSFYDLYEQLGIWPTPEKDKALADKALSGVGKDSEDDAPPSTKEDQDTTDASIQAQFQVSTSTSFSTTSWEATIGAFPMVNHLLTSTLDFGEPVVGDADIVETLDQYPSNDDAASDVLGDSAVRTSSSGTTQQQQTVRRAPSTTGKHGDAAVTSTSAPTGRTGSYGISREASGSGGSSRNSSRNRRPRDDDHRRAREEGGWFGGMPSGSSSESDEHDDRDDVPLSKLHPQAAAARQNTQERRKQRRADKLREKVRGRMSKQKVAGRNPGGGCNWDGEGGVPPDILVRRLEKVMISRTNELPAQNCSTAPGGVLSQRIQSEQIPVHSRPHPTLRPQRSFTNPNHTTADKDIPGNGVQRSQTLTRPRSSGRSQRPSSTMPSLPFDSLQPSPTTLQRPTSPASYPAGSRAAVQQGDQPLQSRPGPSRQNSNATSSSHGHTRLAPVPAVTGTADVTRSNTNATQRSYLSRQRSRAMSSTASTHQPTGEDNTHVRSTTEPVASRERTAHLVNAFIGSMNGKRIILETFPETTLRDTLLATHQRGDLVKPASGMSWVVVEVFAELGCERYVREYEPLQTVVRGWDQSAKFNCLVFRESNRAVPTLAKAIPSNPPFLGSYIQCETKKGKWSKRWLETRGGQVFLSKNDKNKDEIEINTSFHDVYNMTRAYAAPKPFVFVIKRIETSSSFENPGDYAFMFACDESLGWKLIAAIYDAKSYTLAQKLSRTISGTDAAGLQRRPTMKAPEGGPLVSFEKGKEVELSAFTGKGLLKE